MTMCLFHPTRENMEDITLGIVLYFDMEASDSVIPFLLFFGEF